ncbi:phosphate propanoyltransferase [Pseudobacillus wudalianchiensis]|uniref:Phosphate propanoyltransferase n=1 Tax=Pseudobacillus wudalianchiensis TaxID=1743143 RepID=A0A1B9B6N2_9BACI|nr:phosphate propanoyltransferase [Bacillus wudalianchiensis]OCA91757.1 propanediol utilization protein [Bacillus wudalianchiensis]
MTVITESKLRAMLKKGIPNPYTINGDEKITPAAMDFLRDRKIAITNRHSDKSLPNLKESITDFMVPVGVSNRHIHLSTQDIHSLFGDDYHLTPYRDLSQPGQFAAKEQLTLLGPKGIIKDVRILGPARGETQVEISITDGFQLGVHPPVRLSGIIEDTPGLTLIGPKGCISLQRGVIVAKRHVHMSPEDAQKLGVEHGDTLLIQTTGERSIIFSDVIVRVSSSYRLDFHIDLDEGNAAGLKTGDYVQIIGKNGEFLSRPRG